LSQWSGPQCVGAKVIGSILGSGHLGEPLGRKKDE